MQPPNLYHAYAYAAFCDALNELKPGWIMTDEGLLGPENTRLTLAQHHGSSSDGHVDVLFEPDKNTPSASQLWDCVTGYGPTLEDKAKSAAYLWSQTTAGALLEFKYSGRGEFADHYHGNEPDGFQGWHVLCGAIVGFGHGDSPDILQQWYLKNPILPCLSLALSESLTEQTCPHGIKIFMGGDGIAEVRLDGERHEVASEALVNLDWPRLDPLGFIRSYLLVLHREP